MQRTNYNKEELFELALCGGENSGESVSILLLAAGSSSRLGQSKQLLSINGESLLHASASKSLQVRSQVMVVLGAHFEIHFKEINHLPLQIIENQHWQKGMGSSLKIGLDKIVQRWPSTSSLIVMVCDQPLLTSTHLQKLIDVSAQTIKKITASYYENTLGVPALFKRECFEKLKQLADSEGAKKLIQQMKSEVEAVEFQGGEIDIDTPEDLKKLKNSQP